LGNTNARRNPLRDCPHELRQTEDVMRDMLFKFQSTEVFDQMRSTEPNLFRRLRERMRAWVEARAAIAAEAALYHELSRLSDAELERRGIPRGELHRSISRHSE
jgi:hypothetical protein